MGLALQWQQMEVLFNDFRATLWCDMRSIECKNDVLICETSGFVRHEHTDVVCDTLHGKDVGKEWQWHFGVICLEPLRKNNTEHRFNHIRTKSFPFYLNRSQISVFIWKQTPSLQSNPKTSLDRRNPTMGNCIELKSRDTRAIPVKSAMHNNRCSTVCS